MGVCGVSSARLPKDPTHDASHPVSFLVGHTTRRGLLNSDKAALWFQAFLIFTEEPENVELPHICSLAAACLALH
jgi:hypothetical protein